MHRSVTAAALLLSSVAVAQPSVPAGLSIRQIAPLVDGDVPKLSAINDPTGFGIGVVTGVANFGVASFRLLSPSGAFSSLGTFVHPDLRLVKRIRLDSNQTIAAGLHATLNLVEGTQPAKTAYLTISPELSTQLRWIRGSLADEVDYDFVIANGSAGNPAGAVLYDGDGQDGTELARMSTSFEISVVANNALPSGRTDTDVEGMQIDSTGLYGGGVLFADSDASEDLVSGIYEIRDTASSGSFRVISERTYSSTRYGDLDIAPTGPFGGVIYVTETLTDEIQQVAPDGTHTTWASGFVGIDSLSISPDGESMYVADLNGVWLIRPEGNEPGPAVLATDPSASGGTQLCGSPVNALRVIFTEPVSFTDADVTITNSDGQPVGFDASGSGSQFMIIGLATPLSGDTYTVTIADTLTSVTTGQPLDGDNDGVAGADAVLTFTHACEGDIADDFGTPGGDGMVSFGDFLRMLAIVGACP